jgi:hypothetical protein
LPANFPEKIESERRRKRGWLRPAGAGATILLGAGAAAIGVGGFADFVSDVASGEAERWNVEGIAVGLLFMTGLVAVGGLSFMSGARTLVESIALHRLGSKIRRGVDFASILCAGLMCLAVIGTGVWGLSLVPGSKSDGAGAIPLLAVPEIVAGVWFLVRLGREFRRRRRAAEARR